MIRKRVPRSDDRPIYRMVIEELVPYSQFAFSPRELDPRSVSRRLDRSTTYVLSGSGRKPFGFISFFVKAENLFIDMLALHRQCQGRGWGGRLLQAAERAGRLRRCRRAFLYVDEINIGAQKFYLRHGYAVDGYVPGIRCYRLVKRL